MEQNYLSTISGQAENMEWLVMDAEILSFMKQFHLWYCKNSFSDLPEL